MQPEKRSTSFYLTNRAHSIIEELAENWGIPKNSVVEIAVRILIAEPRIFARLLADHIEEEQKKERGH